MFSYVDINYDNIDDIVKKLAKLVMNSYDFDLIIEVASGGTLIGEILSRLTNVKLLEVKSSRNGIKRKKDLSSLISKLPKKVLILAKEFERKSTFHDKNKNRKITFNEEEWIDIEPSKILIIDDAIDTGYTMEEVMLVVNKIFPNSEIKVAVISYFTDRVINTKPDFSLYVDSVISAPWTIDSREYIIKR